MVRLFHTLQEMDYLPVREEIRERVAAMWGVTPAWQGAPEAFGGLSTQTQQLIVMSRVVEGDQRLLHEKVFPTLLEEFGITGWKLQLGQPEEKAEATMISFAQQRVAVASQLNQMGFTVKLQDGDIAMEDARFVISGEAVPLTQLQGEQTALQLNQQIEQQEQQQAAAGGAGAGEAVPAAAGEQEDTGEEAEPFPETTEELEETVQYEDFDEDDEK
jgi:hypothetical protein